MVAMRSVALRCDAVVVTMEMEKGAPCECECEWALWFDRLCAPWTGLGGRLRTPIRNWNFSPRDRLGCGLCGLWAVGCWFFSSLAWVADGLLLSAAWCTVRSLAAPCTLHQIPLETDQGPALPGNHHTVPPRMPRPHGLSQGRDCQQAQGARLWQRQQQQ